MTTDLTGTLIKTSQISLVDFWIPYSENQDSINLEVKIPTAFLESQINEEILYRYDFKQSVIFQYMKKSSGTRELASESLS